MKACPLCQRLYEPAAGFCPADGSPLKLLAEVPAPSDPDDPRIGAPICTGRYEIRRKVADGGMGRVYQAYDRHKDCGVAVKVLHAGVAIDRVSVERFKREYALSSRLPHDHIVEVRDFQATEDDSYALVMEYLEGEELRELLKREKVTEPARLIRILSQLAIGLREPHSRKYVHRDIKPDNVFLCHTAEGPRVKLLDFGSVRDNTEEAKKLTVIGTTIGSPFYMAPEQAQGLRELDQRADVWSLAAIAYECLTGSVPFAGSTGPQILLAILSAEPEAASLAGRQYNVPITVDDVFSDGLAKNPDTRIGSVAEMADRFGHAYGLQGSHLDWAYLGEAELHRLVEANLPAAIAALHAQAAASSAAAAAAAAVGGAPSPAAFHDEDFVMGVPSGPPKGLFVGLGVGALLLVVALVAVFVW